MKPWEFKAKPVQAQLPEAQPPDFDSWAADLLKDRDHVYMEMPAGPNTSSRVFELVRNPVQLAEMRRQAEGWPHAWWSVCVTYERALLDQGRSGMETTTF